MIFDGDNRLLCKIAEQSNLLLAKWLDLLPKDGDCANQLFVIEHRYNDDRTRSTDIRERYNS